MLLTPFDISSHCTCSDFGCVKDARKSDGISNLPGVKLSYAVAIASSQAPISSVLTQPLATWMLGRRNEVTALKCQLGWESKHDYAAVSDKGFGKYYITDSELTRQGFMKNGKWAGKYGINCADCFLSLTTMQESIMDAWIENTYTAIISNRLPINNTSTVNALGLVSVALRSTPSNAVKWALTGVPITNTEIDLFNQARYAIEVLLPVLEG